MPFKSRQSTLLVDPHIAAAAASGATETAVKRGSGSLTESDNHPGLFGTMMQALHRVSGSRPAPASARIPSQHDLERASPSETNSGSPPEVDKSVSMDLHLPTSPPDTLVADGRKLSPSFIHSRRLLPVPSKLLPTVTLGNELEAVSATQALSGWDSGEALPEEHEEWDSSFEELIERPPASSYEHITSKALHLMGSQEPMSQQHISNNRGYIRPIPLQYPLTRSVQVSRRTHGSEVTPMISSYAEPSSADSTESGSDRLSAYARGDTPSPAPSIGAAILQPNFYPGSRTKGIQGRRRQQLDVSDYKVYKSVPRDFALVPPPKTNELYADMKIPTWTASLPDTPMVVRTELQHGRRKYRRQLPEIPQRQVSETSAIRTGPSGGLFANGLIRLPDLDDSETPLFSSCAMGLIRRPSQIYNPPAIDPHGPAPSVNQTQEFRLSPQRTMHQRKRTNVKSIYQNGNNIANCVNLLMSSMDGVEDNWLDRLTDGVTIDEKRNIGGVTGSLIPIQDDDTSSRYGEWLRMRPCEVPIPPASSPPPDPAPPPRLPDLSADLALRVHHQLISREPNRFGNFGQATYMDETLLSSEFDQISPIT